MNGETSLHAAIAQEDGTSLHIVDFLVQNSPSLDKQTKDGSTALHVCATYNQSECMKLLLRSGANPQIENSEGKTPMDVSKEKGFHICMELLEHALQNKKTLFENVSIDWGLSQDDGSTDFSDEDFADERGGQITPERRCRSRPSSVVGNESPTSRSSSISEGVKQSPHLPTRPMPPPPPPQSKKPISGKLVLPKSIEFPALKSSVDKVYGTLQRPRCPPPPTPLGISCSSEKLNNGQSTESLLSIISDSDSNQTQTPIPPPRKRHDSFRPRRCRALYDCEADREDELSFKEGEIIIIISEITDDEDWMEGFIEGFPERRGVFPSSFVHILKE
ncbi:arfGAP with SH3 domain, ANK repeat and PH domain-containing protein-like isoform X2 [Centruroides sculpturatus]|nr:arfGAP with SH3 domain, ANK repeat and PH domain-containing protein-like isoform X2 [Centruroides sculpturatus]